MDIGKLFGHTWGLFVKDIGPLIVTTIVAVLAAGVPAAILLGGVVVGGVSGEWTVNEDGTISGAGDVNWPLVVIGSIVVALIVFFITVPFYASMVSIMVRRVREGRVAEYGDMFAGFRQYGQVVSVWLLIGVILGLLAVTFIGIPVAIYLGVLWVYAVVAVVDRRMGFGAATGLSKELVRRSGWWITFLALFVGAIVAGIASALLNMVPVVGSIVAGLLLPLELAYVVAMYFQATGEVQLVDNAVAGLPPAVAGAGSYGAPPAPPAPPAGGSYAAPAAPPAAGQASWAEAADPLAAQPPVAPPLPPAPGSAPAATTPPAPPAPPAPVTPAPVTPVAEAPTAEVPAPVTAAAEAPTSEAPAPEPSAAAAETAAQTAPTQPGMDADSGKLVHHCSQCGAVIEGSAEFCQVCAHEVSGGEAPSAGAAPPAGEPPVPTDDAAARPEEPADGESPAS